MGYIPGREKYGAVKRGQRWRKIDNGMTMTVICKQADNSWRCAFDSLNRKASHKMKERVIYKYYERVA